MENETQTMQEVKRLPGFVRFLRNFFIAIVLLVGTIFACFFVNDKTTVATNDQTNVQTVYYSALSKSVDDIQETKKMKFSLEQIFINSIIEQGLNNAEGNLKKYVTGGYFVLKSDSSFTIGAKLKLGFFVSRVQIVCTYEQFRGDSDTTSGFRLRFNEVTVGRVPGFANLVASIGKALQLDSLVARVATNIGLSVELNLSQKEIIYTFESLKKDLKQIINKTREGEGSTKLEIFEDFIGKFVSQDYVETNIENEQINVNINCESLTEGALDDRKKEYELEGLKNLASTLYEKNKEKISRKDYLQALVFYYIQGYNNLTETAKGQIDELDFSDYTLVEDYKTHTGISSLHEGTTIDNEVDSQILNNPSATVTRIANGQALLDLTDANFAATMRKNKTIVGYSSILERIEDDKLIFNYMIVKDFYCQVKDNQVSFYVTVSLNGLDLNLILQTSTAQDEENRYKLNFIVEKIFLGSNEINTDTMKEILYAMVQSTINNTLTLSETEGKIVISLDFASKLSANTQINNAIVNANKRVRVDTSVTDHIKIFVS